MNRSLIIAAVAVVVGIAAGQYYLNHRAKGVRSRLHAEIAALRTYEEGYALRHGHYLMLPDSCQGHSLDPWKELGKAPPEPKVGCFWVTADRQAGQATHAMTAPTMLIVGENTAARLRGVESSDDREPSWITLEER